MRSHPGSYRLISMLVVALAATACSSGNGAPSPSASGGLVGSGVTIGFSVPEFTASFWVSVAYGIAQEAKLEGATVITENAGGDANADQQITQIQDLIQRKVSVIVVGATDGNAIAAVVNQAVAAGIPVVGISSLPNSDKMIATIGADHYGMGKLQAECLGKQLNGTGDVGLMAGPAGQSWADARAKGFSETLATTYPNMKILATDRNGDERASSLKVMQAWIQKYPTMVGVYTATDDIGAGALDAIKAAGKSSQIKVSSSNLSPIGVQLLQSGDLVCETTQQVVLQGQDALKAAVTAATGGQPQKVTTTSVIAVTKESLATLDTSLIAAPEGYQP